MQFRVFLMATLLYNWVSAPPTQLITQKETFKYRLNSTSALPVCFKAKKSWTNYCTPSIPWLMPLSCLRHRGDLLSHFWHFGIYSEWFFFFSPCILESHSGVKHSCYRASRRYFLMLDLNSSQFTVSFMVNLSLPRGGEGAAFNGEERT